MKTTKIITALLAMLGFVGCDENNNNEKVMYGVPSAGFQISGRVTDEAGDPVKDIKVVVSDVDDNHAEGEVGVGITNATGHYSISGSWFGGSNLAVSTEDIDGDNNGGEFAAQAKELRIVDGDYVGGSGWNRGKVTKSADFTLTLKQQEEDENE